MDSKNKENRTNEWLQWRIQGGAKSRPLPLFFAKYFKKSP